MTNRMAGTLRIRASAAAVASKTEAVVLAERRLIAINAAWEELKAKVAA